VAYKNDILLGRITKVSGYEGAIAVKLDKIFTENIPLMESVFLEIEGKPVPFFISGTEYSGTDILKLWLEGYDAVEKISEFKGCRVFLTTGLSYKNQKEKNRDLIGYKVFIQDDKLLGSISEIIPNSGQLLLNIKSIDKKNILVPFHEHFIVNINKKKKIILMDIPEGLIDIN
jgi:16S rRNA processing protein RimM